MVGAGGEVGREVAAQLVESGVLSGDDELLLVGHRGGPSELAIHGLAIDMCDAFAEDVPRISFGAEATELDSDAVVFVAGASVPHRPTRPVSRQVLAERNLPLLRGWADRLAASGNGREFVIVVTNPVELGVQVFSDALGPDRVVGAGALSDSLRLRREVARAAGVRRQDVSAMVLGQHGPNLLPIWSSLAIRGWDAERTARLVAGEVGGRTLSALPGEIGRALTVVTELLSAGDGARCVEYVKGLPIGVRIGVKPFFVHYTGRTTAVATAHAAALLVDVLGSGETTVVPAQVCVDLGRESAGASPIGVPIALNLAGWAFTGLEGIQPAERARLLEIDLVIRAEIAAAMGLPGPSGYREGEPVG